MVNHDFAERYSLMGFCYLFALKTLLLLSCLIGVFCEIEKIFVLFFFYYTFQILYFCPVILFFMRLYSRIHVDVMPMR